MPVAKLHSDAPQGLFITPEDNFVDLLSTYLPTLTSIEGLPRDEFLSKAANNEKEFAYAPTDDDQ